MGHTPMIERNALYSGPNYESYIFYILIEVLSWEVFINFFLGCDDRSNKKIQYQADYAK